MARSIAPARLVPFTILSSIQIPVLTPSFRDSRDPPPSTLTSQTTRQLTDESATRDETHPVPETPPTRLTHNLLIRTSPTRERPRPRRDLSPESPEASLTSASELPASTAPPKPGRSKRKRVHTEKYKKRRPRASCLSLKRPTDAGASCEATARSNCVTWATYATCVINTKPWGRQRGHFYIRYLMGAD